MTAGDSSGETQTYRPLLRFMRTLFGGAGDGSLREAIESALEEHEDDVEAIAGDLSHAERMMLRNLLDFGERRAGDIMVPRGDIIAFDAASDFPALTALFVEAGHSRLPVYRASLDEISGMIHVKDAFEVVADHGRQGIADFGTIVRPVLFVPPTMRVLDLLARMRGGRTHMAIIVDEYGGTDGLVTIEDIVEEIVGDIEDEHDEEETESITAIPGGGYQADARLGIDALENHVGAELSEAVDGEIDTVGGLLFMLAGRVPAVGETIDHPMGWRFEVLEGDGRKIERVRMRPLGN